MKDNIKKKKSSKAVPKTKKQTRSNMTTVKKSKGTSTDLDKKIKKVKKSINKKKNKVVIQSKIRLTVAICIFLLVISFLIVVFATDIFKVSNILVEGNSIYSKEDVIKNLNKKIGTNIFFFDKSVPDIAKENMPYIGEYDFKIKLPKTIVVKVKERQSTFLAYDKEKNTYYRLDSKGNILENILVENIVSVAREDEMYLYGLTFFEETKLGSRVNNLDLEKLLNYIKIQDIYNSSKIGMKITKVELDKTLTTITLDDKLDIIMLYDMDIKYKLVLLENILKELPDKKGTIDLTKTSPTYSNIR